MVNYKTKYLKYKIKYEKLYGGMNIGNQDLEKNGWGIIIGHGRAIDYNTGVYDEFFVIPDNLKLKFLTPLGNSCTPMDVFRQ